MRSVIVRHKGLPFPMDVHDAGEYISDRIAYKEAFYELPLLNYIADNYPDARLIVDCGANIGNHTAFFAGVMGAEVIAFEPAKANFELLERNKAGLKNITTWNIALGAKYGEGSINPAPGNMGAGRMEGGEGVTITSLDSLWAIDRGPDIIKVDVEGMEPEVIDGALDTIERYRPVLFVEHQELQNLYKTAALLVPLGYVVRPFTEPTWEMFEYIPKEKLCDSASSSPRAAKGKKTSKN